MKIEENQNIHSIYRIDGNKQQQLSKAEVKIKQYKKEITKTREIGLSSLFKKNKWVDV